MNEQAITDLIAAGRLASADWLPGRAPIEDIAPILVGMANSDGGVLVLGIAPRNDMIVGVDEPDAAIERVLKATLATTPPLIIPLAEKTTIGTFTLVYVNVPRGLPHIYAYDGRFLVRDKTENKSLDARDLRRLLIQRGEVSFEEDVPVGVKKDDLDWVQVESYIADLKGFSGLSAEDVLVKRGCMVRKDDALVPTNAGILLFGKAPQEVIRGSEITAARFAGTVMGDTFTRQDIGGTLPAQLRRAQTFLADNLRKQVQMGAAMARDEHFEYPMEAAREVVVNAVAHRDYSIQGDGVRLYVFSDHMEVNSPGGLPGPVTVDNIADERFSRNPIIVQVLSDMGFIERLGYGIDRVISLMKAQQLPKPEFEESAGGVRVVLRSMSDDEGTDSPAAQPTFHGQYQGIEINPRQEYALDFLVTRGNPRITNKDLQEMCPDVHAETLRRDFADLVTKGILLKMGQKRGSYYVLKK